MLVVDDDPVLRTLLTDLLQGAGYVVLGQVQRQQSQVRVLAHLIHLPEQTHVAVARFDRALEDPLRLQTELARAIAAQFATRIAK